MLNSLFCRDNSVEYEFLRGVLVDLNDLDLGGNTTQELFIA